MDNTEEAAAFRRKIAELETSLALTREAFGALEESEKRYRSLLDLAQDIVFIVDKDGCVQYVNAYAAGRLGRAPGDVVGRNLRDIFPPQVFEFQDRNLRVVFDTGRAHSSEDGFTFQEQRSFLHTVLVPLGDGDGGVRAVLGISRDITALKRAEETLRERERFYHDVLNGINDGICIISANYRIMYQNQAHKDLVGDHTGEHCYAVFERRTGVCPECPVALSFEDGATHSIERTVQGGRGTICLEITASALKGPDGKPVAAIEVDRDITRRKKMEVELLKVHKLESLGLLAGGIAHDFNNILTAITGNIGIAKKRTAADGEVHGVLVNAEKAALRARDLARQLLTFSRGGAPVKEIVSLADLLIDSACFPLKGSNVRCELSVPGDLWHIEADEGQISQVINNLVLNAKEAMPGGGAVRVTAENVSLSPDHPLPLKGKSYVKIDIQDQGAGISEEHLHRIFDPFFTTKPKGSGLGLTIVFSIVKRHDGHIIADSKPGAGTTFSVYLPALPKEIRKEQGAQKPVVHGKGRVLVMDDEEMIRNALCMMLAECGYEADPAGEGAETVLKYQKALAEKRPYDAVILDLTIAGGMGGNETLQRLRAVDPGVKAVMSSGYSNDPVMAEYRAFGFKAALPKPYDITDLSRIVSRVIAGPEV